MLDQRQFNRFRFRVSHELAYWAFSSQMVQTWSTFWVAKLSAQVVFARRPFIHKLGDWSDCALSVLPHLFLSFPIPQHECLPRPATVGWQVGCVDGSVMMQSLFCCPFGSFRLQQSRTRWNVFLDCLWLDMTDCTCHRVARDSDIIFLWRCQGWPFPGKLRRAKVRELVGFTRAYLT